MDGKYMSSSIHQVPQLSQDQRHRSGKKLRIAAIGGRGVPSSYSGIERIWECMFDYFVQLGHQVTVYCRPQIEKQPGNHFRGMRQVHLPAPGGRNLETVTHSILAMLHAIRYGDANGQPFDVISVHALAPNLALPIAKLGGVPVVSHVHGLDHRREKWKGVGSHVIMLGERLMVKMADRVAVVSNELTQYYEKEYKLPTYHLPNGVVLVDETFEPHKPTLEKFGLTVGNYVTSICRLVPEKRIHDTITAYKRVNTKFPYVIVGDGSSTPEYLEKIKKLAADDPRVIFTGHQSGEALNTLFRSAGLYVTASELEGWPTSLVECVDCEVPAVTSSIPPHMELMSAIQGYDLHFPVGDIEKLTDRIQYALSNIAHVWRLAVGGRNHVRTNYAWPALALKMEQLYSEVASARGNR
jgi:glycosyltransferase involved in cell wall biosynthesis